MFTLWAPPLQGGINPRVSLHEPPQESLVTQTLKECACDAGDLGSVLGSGRSPGEGSGNLLQYSCLENPSHGQGRLAGHSLESQRVGTRLSDLTHTHPRKRCFLFLAQLAPRRVRLELLLPPCPLQGRTVSGWRMKQAIGRSRGKMESWWGQLNACVEPCQKPAPSTGVQFSLGLFVRFLPSVPVVAWATVLIQCVSLSRRTFPSSNPTCVPFELSQCACPSLCFSWDVQPH